MPESSVATRRERIAHLWRPGGPLWNIGIVLGVFGVVVLLLPVILAVAYSAAREPPSTNSMYVDTSTEATCTLKPETRGSTTTVELPLRETDWGAAAQNDLIVTDVTDVRSTNAIISTKHFIGAAALGTLRFEVRPLNPDLPYSIDGIRIEVTRDDRQRGDLLRLALRSTATTCDTGLGHEFTGTAD